MKKGFILLFSIIIYAIAAGADSTISVLAKSTPASSWKTYPTRTLRQLSGFSLTPIDDSTSPFGGLKKKKTTATGFFHVKKIDGRWWLVDPLGYLTIGKGVTTVDPGTSAAELSSLNDKFGSADWWATVVTNDLRSYGFNQLGNWSRTDLLQKPSNKLPYTLRWNFMLTYKNVRPARYQKIGADFPNDCIPVFDPEFPTFCDSLARSLTATAADPFLIGHFSDNELPFRADYLNRYLTLLPDDPGNQKARTWLAARQGGVFDSTKITIADQSEFLLLAAETYFSAIGNAIRKYDPNHLSLGPRFHGSVKNLEQLFRAAGKFCDVIAVNYYSAWGPNLPLLQSWTDWSGRPCLISEFYVKGEDSGLPNSDGAGWIVKSQADRGLFYQHFTLGLIESKNCVGWHWFRYKDNDIKTTPSASNKGLFTMYHEPWLTMQNSARELNDRVYRIVEHFDDRTSVGRDRSDFLSPAFYLQTAYPNPFNPTTTIMYSIPMSAEVSLKIYDPLGREVASLVNEIKSLGRHSVNFNGSKLSSGQYIAVLTALGELKMQKLVLVK